MCEKYKNDKIAKPTWVYACPLLMISIISTNTHCTAHWYVCTLFHLQHVWVEAVRQENKLIIKCCKKKHTESKNLTNFSTR